MKSKKKIIIKLHNKSYLRIKCFNRNKLKKTFLYTYQRYLKKSKFIINKKKNYLDQINYIKNINKSIDKIIFLLEFNKKFIGTIGAHKVKKNIILGIFIFSKKVKNKNYSKYFLFGAIKLLNHIYKINNYCAFINSNNLKSINLFKRLGFKFRTIFEKNIRVYLNYKTIKIPNNILEYSIK
jgi:RimJ/RimL family protein N-acetyltransferase